MAFDWEECVLTLLEQNLNGHSLNASTLKEIFPEDILAELNIMDAGNTVDDIDKHYMAGDHRLLRYGKPNPRRYIIARRAIGLSSGETILRDT